MTITRPNEADAVALIEGAVYKINGRKYTVGPVDSAGGGARYMTGARGGWANLVPSTCGKAVQVTTISSRHWVETIEEV